MKKLQNVAAFLIMFCMIIAILITSFQIAVYGDPHYRFYESLYEKYHVADDLDMKMSDVMEVTDVMMAYLIGEKESLSVVTDVDGRRQDFFNEQDRLHMADVKRLFLGGLALRNILAGVAAVLIIALVFTKAKLYLLLPKAYMRALKWTACLTALLGIACLSDFEASFTMFHKLFFTNNLWLFDPETDYMIWMLPEGFFRSMALKIGIFFMAGICITGLLFSVWKRIGAASQEEG